MGTDIPRFITKDMLREIRNNADWREVFYALGIQRDEGKSNEREWWGFSPFTDEKTASFHMSDQGWYCHSSAPDTKGGGVIELVQAVISRRTGHAMNCYEAGRWLLEQGLSQVSSVGNPASVVSGFEGSVGRDGEDIGPRREEKENLGDERDVEKDENKENRPIRQTLLPALDREHPEIQRRGISKETAQYRVHAT